MIDSDATIACLKSGTVDILVESELKSRLATGKPLRVKAGFDPTAPDLHLGHFVLLNKLHELQQLGHKIIFIVGDFTAMIGDPTGKNVTRKPLDSEQVKKNAATYAEQVFKVLDSKQTELIFNSSWLSKFSAADTLQLGAKYNVARMLERDDFTKRYKNGDAIAIHEFFYPLLQGYDSVAIEADLELGGTDQRFNLLVGREIQRAYGKTPQIVATLPLLEGLDGVQKMSKSLNNYIGISEDIDEIFGKTMSISDELMWRYFDLLGLSSPEEILAHKEAVEKGANPKDIKVKLAEDIVAKFYTRKDASIASANFVARFKEKKIPKDIPLTTLKASDKSGLPIANVLKELNLVPSTSHGLRMIQQGAVKVNEEKVCDKKLMLTIDKEYLLQVGKRKFARLRLTI